MVPSRPLPSLAAVSTVSVSAAANELVMSLLGIAGRDGSANLSCPGLHITTVSQNRRGSRTTFKSVNFISKHPNPPKLTDTEHSLKLSCEAAAAAAASAASGPCLAVRREPLCKHQSHKTYHISPHSFDIFILLFFLEIFGWATFDQIFENKKQSPLLSDIPLPPISLVLSP